MAEQRTEETRTFGVEEEYLLLDAETGCPADRAAELIGAVPQLGDHSCPIGLCGASWIVAVRVCSKMLLPGP